MDTQGDENDCLSCRLISSGGLMLASAYIYRQSIHKSKFNRYGMVFVSAGNRKEINSIFLLY